MDKEGHDRATQELLKLYRQSNKTNDNLYALIEAVVKKAVDERLDQSRPSLEELSDEQRRYYGGISNE